MCVSNGRRQVNAHRQPPPTPSRTGNATSTVTHSITMPKECPHTQPSAACAWPGAICKLIQGEKKEIRASMRRPPVIVSAVCILLAVTVVSEDSEEGVDSWLNGAMGELGSWDCLHCSPSTGTLIIFVRFHGPCIDLHYIARTPPSCCEAEPPSYHCREG